MFLRATIKLSKKLNIKSFEVCETRISAFEEWYGHLFTVNRLQYILFTNAYSLFSTIIPAKGINNIKTFIWSTNYYLAEVLREENCENMLDRLINSNNKAINICKTNNRGILGSMNDMIFHSKVYLSDYQLSPLEISSKLNKMPYSYLQYNNPLDVIKKMALT